MNDVTAPDPLDQTCITTLRTLAMDAVEQAKSGHPGTPMALAPVAYVLWQRLLRHNPANPAWPDRDRFVLSNGHASMLLYGLLHLTGYDLPLAEIERFRQWGSRTPGHPEHGHTPGVETTTGPLGQGFMNAVGMALAEAHLAARYNRPGHTVVDHRTFVFLSDGDLMEGASHEAASLAGSLGLGKLVALYDDNHITIDGPTEITFADDSAARFAAYGWHVQTLGDCGNDLAAIEAAFHVACAETERPSLIVLRTHIAWGAPNAQDTAGAHGAPLGPDEVKATKTRYGWPEEARFAVPERVRERMGEARVRGATLEAEWQRRWDAYAAAHPGPAAELRLALAGELPAGWDAELPQFPGEEAQVATRKAGGKVLAHFAKRIPALVGGAADLASSTKAELPGDAMRRGDYAPRNIHFGVREHAMAGICSGLALHGGLRPFASTFFIFSDYMRPAMRLAALMRLPVIYALSHDSIGLGEDGPTHQPVEHLASFRAMPHMHVIRPGDAAETAHAWRVALARRDGPTIILLTRQKLPVFDRQRLADAVLLERGGYVLSPEVGDLPQALLIATGSELHLAVAAQGRLRTECGIDTRVVSLPCWELFRAQPRDYREAVLPPAVTARLAVEAGAGFGWCEWVGERGGVLGLDRFGASAPGEVLFEQLGFTVENVMAQTLALLSRERTVGP